MKAIGISFGSGSGSGAEPKTPDRLACLDLLEAESIHIIREAVAEFRNPAMLYSIGKDSSVMLELARKAFAPGKPPFPLLYIDTGWKFRDMIRFRDETAARLGLDLIVHEIPDGAAPGIGRATHGSGTHADSMGTRAQALKQALDEHGFDVTLNGARRDEEKSCANERIFSFRGKEHRRDAENRRPEPWNLYNSRIAPGENVRVFPLSDWTEIDIWHYIHRERIPVMPLYFAARRPVVRRDGALIVVDDDRVPLEPGERPSDMTIRFRTLGCYPLTGAVESRALTVPDIVMELAGSRVSERKGRVTDGDRTGAMEHKKQENNF